MKKKITVLLLYVFNSVVFLHCEVNNPSSKDDLTTDEKLNQITSFQFLKESYSELEKDHTATVDEEKKLITVFIPSEITRKLVPSVKTTQGSVFFAASGSLQDFLEPVAYEVRSNHTNGSNYTVFVASLANESRIFSFS